MPGKHSKNPLPEEKWPREHEKESSEEKEGTREKETEDYPDRRRLREDAFRVCQEHGRAQFKGKGRDILIRRDSGIEKRTKSLLS